MMYKDKLVLSIMCNNSPVREYGSFDNKIAYLPYDSEYVVRLRNKTNVPYTARVFIDGSNISNMGDIIVNENQYVDLERFIDSSLSVGKKFKFVSLSHPDVDDPYRDENGLVRVEFRKKIETINFDYSWYNKYVGFDDGGLRYNSGLQKNVFIHSYTNGLDKKSLSCSSNYISGATVEGSNSTQSFVYSSLNVEDKPSVVMQLRIVYGNNVSSKKILFCQSCGNKLQNQKNNIRYCGYCGYKLK